MSFGLLKNVFPNFGEGEKTFVEHNYQQILEKEDGNQAINSYEKEIGAPIELPKTNPSEQLRREVKVIEKFEDSHKNYEQHLLTCEECKQLLQKLNKKDGGGMGGVDELLIEMGVYILFGVFILALLEAR